MTRRLNFKNILHTFFLFFCILLLFAMSLKNRNGSLSGYDLVICCTTYANLTIYLLIPFIFMNRMKNEVNPNSLIRYKNVDYVWISGCKSSFCWAIEITASLMICFVLCGWLIADSVCDWNRKQSIFFRATQYSMSAFPTVKEILIPAFVILFFNILLIELLTFAGFWYVNSFWVGYTVVIIVYLLPELTKMQIEISRLGLYYMDYCLGMRVIDICLKRVMVLICLSVVMVVLGLIRRKKDFLS